MAIQLLSWLSLWWFIVSSSLVIQDGNGWMIPTSSSSSSLLSSSSLSRIQQIRRTQTIVQRLLHSPRLEDSWILNLSNGDGDKSVTDDDDDDKNNNNNNNDIVERTSFDQAGRSLIEQEDEKRLRQMGDFDANDDQNDSMERMRAAIRERAAKMGVEKSKVSAEYITQKAETAKALGPMNADPNMFGGLDLSKISDTKLKQSAASKSSSSSWDEDMPSMFYDPEKELSKEQQEEADPLMTKSIIEQYLYEISQAKWPTPVGALREVALMMVVIAFSAILIVGWDRILREFYTTIGFIPTKEDVANYAARFDGLDLPDGWMDNMNDADVSQLSETLNTATQSYPPNTINTNDITNNIPTTPDLTQHDNGMLMPNL